MALNSSQNYFSNFQIIFELFIHKCMFITLCLYLVVLFRYILYCFCFILFCATFTLFIFILN